MSSMKDKMHTGELYLPGDEEIMRHQLKRLDRLYDFNMTRPTELKKREEMLREMFAEIGDDCYIEPPFHSNFGGEHVHFGNHIYANFGLTLVDDTHIRRRQHNVRPSRYRGNRRSPDRSHAQSKGIPIQYADSYRQELLDRRRRAYSARRYDRR